MPSRDLNPFTATLNPFRALDRQIDRMFDEDFGAAAAGAVSRSGGAVPESQAPSLFMRVVAITSRGNDGENG